MRLNFSRFPECRRDDVIGQGRSKEEFCRTDLGANQMNAIQAYLNILDNTDATLTRV